MTGSRHDRSIANLPSFSFDHALNDDELDALSNLKADNLDESLPI